MEGAGRRVARAAGWLLLLLPFIPLRRIFDDPPGTTWLLSPYEWLLGLFIFGTLAWLWSRVSAESAERVGDRLALALARPSATAFRLGALLALAGILFLTSTFAFSRSPLLIDAIIQVFQGKIFASGHAWAPAPGFEGFFTTQHMLSDGGRWYSQYPPGQPAVMAVGTWIGAQWLMPILLTLISAWLITDAARRVFGESVARLTLVLLVIAPFFWFMGASHMNHVPSLAGVAFFLWCFVRWAEGGERPGVLWIFLAGVGLGWAFLSRPLTAAAVGLAFAVPAIRIAGRRWLVAGVAGVAGVAILAVWYFVFNAVTTGDPFVAGYMRLWGEGHELGFHLSPWGDAHTPLTGLRNELIDLGLLHSFLFEWAIPGLLPLGAVLAAGWAAGRWELRFLAAFFAIPAAYFFYWHRDAFLGPRYLYEGLPFLMPLVALAFVELRRRLRGREIRWLAGVDGGAFVVALVVLSFAYSLGYGMPQRFRVYATGMASVKLDPEAEARSAGIDEGLIFVSVSWGNRLIARARGAGASASVIERVYRRSDHCELELVVGRAEAAGWSGDRLDDELIALQRPEDEIAVVRLNDDPTLRLVPNRPLAPACVNEVVYDRDGQDEMPDPPPYTNYSPQLWRNAWDLSGPFVFARDLREQNPKLRALYPDLPAYLYRNGEFLRLD